MRTFESHHYISLITDNTFFATFEQSFFFHQFQSIEYPISLKPNKEYPRKSTSSNAFNNLKIAQFYFPMLLYSPNGFNLQQLTSKHFYWLTSLKIVVF